VARDRLVAKLGSAHLGATPVPEMPSDGSGHVTNHHGTVLRVDPGEDEQHVTVRFDDGTVRTVSIEPGDEFTTSGFSEHRLVFHWEARRSEVLDDSLADESPT
jgi:hypothetical protein